jgi:misacylated tRNA(Ala) deacylase
MPTELIFRDDAYATTASATVLARSDKGIELDRTLFYPLGGGQPGDAGVLVRESGERLSVVDTRKGEAPGSVLHVLSCVVVAPVSGGNIAPDRGRLDFDIEMSQLDAAKIERETNALIARAVDTETVWISDAELDAQPELVKTMSVQPPRGAGRVRLLRIPDIDLQPCGGTHVRNIGEIQGIRVLSLRNVGKRNKRVEIALID